jgi:hypothetical protein
MPVSPTPAEEVAFTADLLLSTHTTDRERTVAELLNYAAAVWDTLPVSMRDHVRAVARAHETDPKTLPPRRQEALAVMAKRGPVRELTAPAPEDLSSDALPAAEGCAQWRMSNGRADLCPMSQCRRCRHLSSL